MQDYRKKVYSSKRIFYEFKIKLQVCKKKILDSKKSAKFKDTLLDPFVCVVLGKDAGVRSLEDRAFGDYDKMGEGCVSGC